MDERSRLRAVEMARDAVKRFDKAYVGGCPPMQVAGGGYPQEAEAWVEGEVEDIEDFIRAEIISAYEQGLSDGVSSSRGAVE